jgi:hypothetical protein
MRIKFLLAIALCAVSVGAHGQETPEPPTLELPMGARVRVQTQASSDWIKGVLASADAGTISLVPEEAPPLGSNQLRLPSEAVTQLEVRTGRKRQWLPGLLAGAALGAALGASMDVDAVRCEFDDNYFCSRGGAIAAMSGTFAGLGALVGSLVKKDIWTPVALDALGPPREKARAEVGLRPVSGGVAVALSVQF